MLKTFHDHTLQTSLLKTGATVLDVGCRGFEFGNALREQYQAQVYEVDIDDLGGGQPYYRCGIAHQDGWGDVDTNQDPLARRLVKGRKIPVYTIQSFGNIVGVHYWDVNKLDCEGAEYGILWHLTKPPATQLTVEFHQHTDARRSPEFMLALMTKLGQWYEIKRHRLYGQQMNYWDTLFVLR